MVWLATWNINSVNAHLTQLLDFVAKYNPDILLLQETKTEDHKFPYHALPGYYVSHLGQKTYNGVAILSKFPIQNIITNFAHNPSPEQARFIQADIAFSNTLLRVVNLYVPNGSEVGSDKFQLKLAFFASLISYLNKLDCSVPTILGGDFNVAPFEIDVHSPEKLKNRILFSPTERSVMRTLLNCKWFDIYRFLHPQTQEFSWWDYRGGSFAQNAGCRIDFLLANAVLLQEAASCQIAKEIRAYDGSVSDHVPVLAYFNGILP